MLIDDLTYFYFRILKVSHQFPPALNIGDDIAPVYCVVMIGEKQEEHLLYSLTKNGFQSSYVFIVDIVILVSFIFVFILKISQGKLKGRTTAW